MAKVKLDYLWKDQSAIIHVAEDASIRQWSAVRRLFEERSSSTKVEGLRVRLPWWEFIAHRDAFKYVLKIGKMGLEVSDQARQLLVKAVNQEKIYRDEESKVSQVSIENIDSSLITVGFLRKLLPYQKRNVSLLTQRNAGASFSVPGAGKTTEALAFWFLTRHKEEKLLIIAPKNAFVAWEEELPVCAPGFKESVKRLSGGSINVSDLLRLNPSVAIISYHQLPYVMDALHAYLARNPVCMMIDESHRMKRGDDGVHGTCLLSVSHLSCRKLLLSGTPMPNSSADLVPQFRFLYPEIKTTNESVISDFQRCFVRTTKGELGLPPVKRILHSVEMTVTHRSLYNALASDAVRLLAGFKAGDRLKFREAGRCIQYLLQAASNPGLLASSKIKDHQFLQEAIADGISRKMDEACRLARSLVKKDKKVLIWSGFVKTIEHIAALLSDVGAEFIHGSVATDDDEENLDSREAVIRRFNDPNSRTRVLVANPAACSEGISLHHVCHHAIYVERNYNAAQYLQSEDRIHRIGLAKDVTTFITVLVSPGTIDESVTNRLNQKVDQMCEALNDPHLNVTPIGLDELADGLDSADIEDVIRLLEGTK